MPLSLLLLTLAVGFGAGLIRGFAGFGGPAFILAILTWFMTPIEVVGKVLLVEFVAAVFLAWKVRAQVNWSNTLALTIPAFCTMPIGHWLLMHTDAEAMRRAIAAAILLSSLMMLLNLRLSRKLTRTELAIAGAIGGIVMGASYIALVLVSLVLLGAYDRSETRTLIVISALGFASWYLLISVYRLQTNLDSVVDALPMGIAYFAGSLLGASWFKHATEASYRKFALYLLLLLGLIGVLR